jgi:glucose repression regulatory protein TUP1
MADSEGTWIRGIDTHKSAVAFGLFGRGRDDKRVFFIDPDGHRHGIYGHTFSIQDVHLIEDGKTIVSVGGDREIKFWNSDSFEQRLAIRESEILTTAAVSPDESVIAAGTREGSVLLYHSPKSGAKK